MATKCTCDNCHAEGAFRVVINLCTNGGDLVKGQVPKFDGELCLECFTRVKEIIKFSMPASALVKRP